MDYRTTQSKLFADLDWEMEHEIEEELAEMEREMEKQREKEIDALVRLEELNHLREEVEKLQMKNQQLRELLKSQMKILKRMKDNG